MMRPMKILASMVHELLGLFVDDQGLALWILGVVAVATLLAFGLQAPPAIVGAVLLLGCASGLIVSVLRAARARV
jgi:hypothetical protein